MKKKLDIFIFIDALGWEIIRNRDFLNDLLPYRCPVMMQFGYSSTAIPTILTGRGPVEHKHLSFYYYNPHHSPFKLFQMLMLEHLPPAIFDRARVRHLLSKFIAGLKGYTGYFEMYAMPFGRLHYFDYIEKNDIFVPGGLAPIPNLADCLLNSGTPAHVSNWRLSETENVNALLVDLNKGEIEFAFLYTAAMDALLHRVTKDGREIPDKLAWYERTVRTVYETARKNYNEVAVHVMSDHGMTTKIGVINVKKAVESEPFLFGTDYAAVYDSTMARFWFFNETARTAIHQVLVNIPHARILNAADKARYRIDFPDNMYGECYLLLDPGYQIEPSDMGVKSLPAMHGYAPEHEDSYACFLSSVPVAPPPAWVGDYFRIMKRTFDAGASGSRD